MIKFISQLTTTRSRHAILSLLPSVEEEVAQRRHYCKNGCQPPRCCRREPCDNPRSSRQSNARLLQMSRRQPGSRALHSSLDQTQCAGMARSGCGEQESRRHEESHFSCRRTEAQLWHCHNRQQAQSTTRFSRLVYEWKCHL